MSLEPQEPAAAGRPVVIGGWYARYVLGLLFLVIVFNVLDRQILAILAEDIKEDLGVSDAQLGFLYGTAFAVFYSVFGIPLARLADRWHRIRLISIGLAFWSLMTVLCGLAVNFVQLAAARLGVGSGEASSGPASQSLIADYFPPDRRGAAFAVYSSGIFVGSGLGVVIGGAVVGAWESQFGMDPPFGLRGWQVAFLSVGIPGILFALWLRTAREPVRGQSDGLVTTQEAVRPLSFLMRELGTILPPFSLWHLRHRPAVLRINLAVLLAIVAAVWALTTLIGNPEQWIALGIGAYALISWAQVLGRRDPPTFGMMFGSPTYCGLAIANGLIAFSGFAIAFWLIPFVLRNYEVNVAAAGAALGAGIGIGGFLGTNIGGFWSDRWRRRAVTGRLRVILVTCVMPVPLLFWLLEADNVQLAYVLFFLVVATSSFYVAPGLSTVQDLVMPRMRATATAVFLLLVTFLGLSMGPYVVGRLSEWTGDLGLALKLAMLANALAVPPLLLAMKNLEREELHRLERARSFGEEAPG